MWTRAPFDTSDTFIARSFTLNREEAGEASPRSEAEQRELEDARPSALDCTFLPNTIVHHDLPEVPECHNRLPEVEGVSIADEALSHMSLPEDSGVSTVRVPLPVETTRRFIGCMTKERIQVDDMQITIANVCTPASDQEPKTLSIWSSPLKRRRFGCKLADGLETHSALLESEPIAEISSLEACEASDLTAEQHMADLDSPKSSTLEDIDSGAHVSASRGTPEVASPQRTYDDKQVEQENVDQVSERRQSELHFSSTQNVSPQGIESPGCDDTQSTSQFLLSTRRIWKESQDKKSVNSSKPQLSIRQPSRKRKTMASGSGEWLKLSLGNCRQSDESAEDEPSEEQQSPILNSPTSSTDLLQLGIRDFFKFGGSSENEETSRQHPVDVHGSTSTRNTSSPYGSQLAASTHSGETSRRYPDLNPESSHRSGLSRPLFLEPRPRSKDSSWVDSSVQAPRVVQPAPASGGNTELFLSPSIPILQRGYPPPTFSNLSTLPFHTARVLQQFRSEQTDTTSVNAWRSSGHPASYTGAGPSSGHSRDEFQTGPAAPLPWMPSSHDPPQTPPNVAELLNVANQLAFRDRMRSAPGGSGGASTSLLGVQSPHAQGVDPELAWRNLLHRVGGNTLNMPSGFGASPSSQRPAAELMMPCVDREEYMEALKRAVERFQGSDQGAKEEPLTELQRMHRATMFPPAQRSQPGRAFDPRTDASLSRFLGTPSSSGSKVRARAPAASLERQRRILRPHAPRPGLWFTLQASSSQPEASPTQQIPTGYIRVVDGNMTVAAVKKYLANKLGLDSEDEVELTCKGQSLVPSIPLQQVRDGIWQAPITHVVDPSTPQLLSEGKAWKAPDGSVTHVGDVVMVITYGRRPQRPATSALHDAPARPL